MTVDVAVEEVEQAAWTEQYTGLDPELRPLVAAVGGLTVLAVGAWGDSAWHSTAVGLGLHAPPTGRGLDVALALLDKLGARRPVVPVVEGCAPPALLAERGLTVPTSLLRLSAPAGGPGPAGRLRVVAVGADAGSAVASVCLQGFGQVDQRWWRAALGRAGWTQVIAYDGELAVGTAALFVAGDEAWMGSATTVPTSRRTGAHAALLAARLRLAAEQGAVRVSVKCAEGSASHRNLLRAGFAPVHRLVQWRRPPDPGTGDGPVTTAGPVARRPAGPGILRQ